MVDRAFPMAFVVATAFASSLIWLFVLTAQLLPR
jgi:hypothetical protein